MKYLSYLMGADDITDEDITSLGIEIVGKSESGSRMLTIPENAVGPYVELIKAKLTKGFWNEIVGPKEILFVFRFIDGSVEEYMLSPENETEIAKLCTAFNNDPLKKTANVYKYIAGNDFYRDFMTKYYAEKMNA